MKNLFKGLGAIAIICILYFSILGFTNQEVPAKMQATSVSQKETSNQESDGTTLMTALKASGAQPAGTNINIWSQIKDGDYTIEEMEEMTLDCARHLGLEKGAQIDIVQENGYNKVMVTTQRDDLYMTIVMETFKLEGHPAESYFLVDLNLGKSHQEDIPQREGTLIEYYEGQDFDYEYAMTAIGTFSKQMNIDIMREVIEESFHSVEGQVLEGLEDEEYGPMVSLTGYSPKFHNTIQISGRDINLNAAMRYNELDERTYLWIGTPLIATEY